MTIEDTEKLDYLSFNAETGCVSLVISDHLDWDDEDRHRLLLQEKLNFYMAFLQTPSFGEQVSRILDIEAHAIRRRAIRVFASSAIPPSARAFCGYAVDTVADVDCALEFYLAEPGGEPVLLFDG